jgi:hypothetical protein
MQDQPVETCQPKKAPAVALPSSPRTPPPEAPEAPPVPVVAPAPDLTMELLQETEEQVQAGLLEATEVQEPQWPADAAEEERAEPPPQQEQRAPPVQRSLPQQSVVGAEQPLQLSREEREQPRAQEQQQQQQQQAGEAEEAEEDEQACLPQFKTYREIVHAAELVRAFMAFIRG